MSEKKQFLQICSKEFELQLYWGKYVAKGYWNDTVVKHNK